MLFKIFDKASRYSQRTKGRMKAMPKLVSGFTLLYSVLVVSLLLVIGIAVFNLLLKELKLTSQIRDAQKAIFAADTGLECALFWDFQYARAGESENPFGEYTPPVDTLDNGLSGYWDFEEGPPSTVAADSAGGNDGNFHDGTSWVAGKVGSYAVAFDGDFDRIRPIGDSSIENLEQFSVSAWIKPYTLTGGSGRKVALSARSGMAPLTAYELNLQTGTSNKLQFWVGRSEGGGLITVSTLADITTDWYHALLTFDGFDAKFYLNGDIQETTSVTGPVATGDTNGMAFGGANVSNSLFWDGEIDDVREYTRVLKDNEIQALASLNSGGSMSSPASSGSGITCAEEDITSDVSPSSWAVIHDPLEDPSESATVTFDIDLDDGTCSIVTIDKFRGNTVIDARGYNTCDVNFPRRVERGLRAEY